MVVQVVFVFVLQLLSRNDKAASESNPLDPQNYANSAVIQKNDR